MDSVFDVTELTTKELSIYGKLSAEQQAWCEVVGFDEVCKHIIKLERSASRRAGQ
ncbi:hypothetical protein AB4345_05370 [Vibrio breoganii]